MALKNQALTVCYVAWNTSTNAGETGDVSNHTLKLVQDGTEASPTNSPSEVDSTNCPGLYKLALAAADTDFNCIVLAGKSSTSSVSLFGVTIVTEQGVLPTVAPNSSGGFLTYGSSTGQINPSSGKVPATMGSGDYSGNTVQTGDSYARIGSTGSSLTSLAPSASALSTATWTATLAGYIGNLSGGAVALAATALSTATWTTARAGYLDSLDTGVLVDLSQALGAARALDSVADTSLTLNDAFHCAIAVAAGKESVSGTTYTVETPYTGTTLRTFTLDSGTAPTTRS